MKTKPSSKPHRRNAASRRRSFWAALEGPARPDSYVALRGCFSLEKSAEVELHTVGSSWFEGWMDGKWLLEGPLRFAAGRPEYDTHRLRLDAGRHVLAVLAHHIGAPTRLLPRVPPFFWGRIQADGREIPMDWKGIPLDAFRPGGRRINPQLGWMEWRDLGKMPRGWELAGFDDSAWPAAAPAPAPGEPSAARIGNVLRMELSLAPMASGSLATLFGYENDDPPVAFYTRPLLAKGESREGLWWRYDLGRVRLGRLALAIEASAGATVEMASSESLVSGRVFPWINLSTGLSCNLDRFVTREGTQVLMPLTPKGGRFVEVHAVRPAGPFRIREAKFHERGYHPPTEAFFRCGDELLERIWSVGVETYRACAEDALIDNPTRERGQWLGDAASVGLDIAAIAYHDRRLARRSLTQAPLCAREDGLVAALYPGDPHYLPTYALQWTAAVLRYQRITGDREILEELFPAAERNLGAFEKNLGGKGLRPLEGWNFVDWGCPASGRAAILTGSLLYVESLRAMIAWCRFLSRPADRYRSALARTEKAVSSALAASDCASLGYHAVTLAVRSGFFSSARKAGALACLRRHLLDCFPNNPEAPRHSDPMLSETRLISPYFAQFVFPLLIEGGQMDFVLSLYRSCWGWMLEQGQTTWFEVFDPRWSHCHVWSGCPTWQLSRYLGGLTPRFDRGHAHYDFAIIPGDIRQAEVRQPGPVAGSWIEVAWRRKGDRIAGEIRTDYPLALRGTDGTIVSANRRHRFEQQIIRRPCAGRGVEG